MSDQLSLEVAAKMKKSGFFFKRVRFQQSLAKFYEDFFNLNIIETIRIVGSFADGWGFNLFQLNGKLGLSSDIDMTWIDENIGIFHFPDCDCKCEDKLQRTVTMTKEGHVTFKGEILLHVSSYFKNFDESPAKSNKQQSCRPSQDFVMALHCACLPKDSKIPEEAFTERGVHLVNARRPGHAGEEEFRISYTFFEREMFYQMHPVLGMVFVILKYIIKHELQEYGLKSYHAKTLAFYLAKTHKNKDLKEDQIKELTKKALEHLKRNLNKNEGKLKHAFHPNAFVYRKKKPEISDLSQLLQKLDEIIDDIANVLTKYKNNDQHQPVTNKYYAQPFSYLLFSGFLDCKLPMSFNTTEQEETLEWLKKPDFNLLPYKVYAYLSYLASCDSVKQSFVNFFTDRDSTTWDRMKIKKHELFAYCLNLHLLVQDILTIITAVKFGKINLARVILFATLNLKFKHLEFKFGSDSEMEIHIRKNLIKSDSVWLFPIRKSCLTLLPVAFQDLKYKYTTNADHVVINFRAVLNSYRCQFLEPNDYSPDSWFQELKEDPFIDWQDVYAFANISTSLEHLDWAIERLDSFDTTDQRKLDKRLTLKIKHKAQKLKKPSESTVS